MSKFFKALEQAERDRALQQGGAPQLTGRAVSPAPQIEAAELVALRKPPADSAGSVDDHLVSLVAPAAFEAEQYRALRHIVEQLHQTRDLRIVAVSSPGV